jgi:hypothetical protein
MASTNRDYSFYHGWNYMRRDDAQAEIFKILKCDYCGGDFGYSQVTVHEPDDNALISAGLKLADPPAIRGGLHLSGGPALCNRCVKAWRRREIDL